MYSFQCLRRGLIFSVPFFPLPHWTTADAEQYQYMEEGLAPYPGSLRHEESREAIAAYEQYAGSPSEHSDPSSD